MRRCRSIAAAGLLGILGGPRAGALEPATDVRHYLHRRWGPEQGFTTSLSGPMAQTPEGYLWLGAIGGLVRFDGREFRLYDSGSAPALGQNLIWELAVGDDGSLWIGTFGSGAARWRSGRFEAPGEGELAAAIVKSFLPEGPDGVWVATERTGLVRLGPDGAVRLGISEGLPSDYVDNLRRTPDGAIWLRTDVGVSRLAEGRFTHFDEGEGVPPDVETLFVDRGGTLWAGGRGAVAAFAAERFEPTSVRAGVLVTEMIDDASGALWIATRGGLSRLAHGALRSFAAADGVPEGEVADLAVDRDDNVWVATAAGLHRWDGAEFSTVTFGGGRTAQPTALFEDREGTLWVATGGGPHALQDGSASTWGPADGLPGAETTAVAEGASGELWIGTTEGLGRWDEGHIESFGVAAGLPHPIVRSLLAGRDGTLWVGTAGGLCRFAAGRCRPFPAGADLPSPAIRALFEDAAGALWIGTEKGLGRWRDGRLTTWTVADGLANPVVRAFFEAPDGSLWFGTDGGLHRLDGDRLEVLTAHDGLASEVFRCLAPDGRGGFWAGMLGGGLHHVRDGRVFAFAARSGLPSSSIYQLLDDGRGSLWAGTDRGIARLALAELAAVEAGRLSAAAPLVLGRADGMASEDCAGASQPAAVRDGAGRLWFACQGGAVVIEPERVRPPADPPAVVLERVDADEHPIDLRSVARLPPGVTRLEIDWSAPTSRAPETVRFRYRLRGFEEAWVAGGEEPRAVYTRLGPGDYTFEVAARYPAGDWRSPGTAWSFAVAPFFYQTDWFLALCLLAALGLGAGLFGLRARVLRARYAAVLAERGRIAREAHDSLAQGLTAISLQLESVEETMAGAPGEAGKHLDLARALVRNSLAESRRFVWGLRSEALEERGLAAALEDVGRQLTVDSRVAFTLRADGGRSALPAAIEEAIFRIGQEAITNAVRHARAHRVEVELAIGHQGVRLAVRDDGIGFDPDAEHAGFGLSGLRERAAGMGGRLEIGSRPGEGTEVVLTVPA